MVLFPTAGGPRTQTLIGWQERQNPSSVQSFCPKTDPQSCTLDKTMCGGYQQSPGVPVLLHDTSNVLHQTSSTQPVDGERVFDVDGLHSKVDHHGVDFHDLPQQEKVKHLCGIAGFSSQVVENPNEVSMLMINLRCSVSLFLRRPKSIDESRETILVGVDEVRRTLRSSIRKASSTGLV